MTAELIHDIERAFQARGLPATVLRPGQMIAAGDSDIEDALYFQGRAWPSLTLDDWDAHYAAWSFFNPEALCYYLPSLLTLAVRHPANLGLGMDSLLFQFNSPSLSYWSDEQAARYLALTQDELRVFEQAILFLSDQGDCPADDLNAVFTTLTLIGEAKRAAPA